uniref:Uncharacterized protein n=1 Tax=Tanacetum cinerariifolium TaxID=118510 RepID=A0A699ITQ9_TANCI|nr:hypothetical protein [Tanacetum cinerariifolium]
MSLRKLKKRMRMTPMKDWIMVKVADSGHGVCGHTSHIYLYNVFNCKDVFCYVVNGISESKCSLLDFLTTEYSKMRLVATAGPLFLLANGAYTWNGKVPGVARRICTYREHGTTLAGLKAHALDCEFDDDLFQNLREK